MFIVELHTDSYPEVSMEYLGLIPMFFKDATDAASGPAGASELLLGEVADHMNQLYGYGGFRYPFGGTVTEDGTYESEGDEPLKPYATLYSRGYICYIYPYAITAIRDPDTKETKVARFD